MIDMDYTDIKWQQLLESGCFLTAEIGGRIITVHMPVNGVLMQRFGMYIADRAVENVDVQLFENFTELYESMRRLMPLMEWQVQAVDANSMVTGEVVGFGS